MLDTIEGAVTRVGPARVSGQPYYIDLSTPKKSLSTTIFSFRSGETALGDETNWWKVAAKELSAPDVGYALSGKLKSEDIGSEHNIFSGSLPEDNRKSCGLQRAQGMFYWNLVEDHTSFIGTLSPSTIELKGEGLYKSSDDNLAVKYTFSFTGVWDSDSAKLNAKGKTPSWPNGDSEEEVTQATVTTTKPPITKTEGALTTAGPEWTGFEGEFSEGNTIPTSLPEDTTNKPATASEPEDSSSAKTTTSRGLVAGVTVGAVSGLVLLGSLAFWARRRWIARNNQVYPELAWLYTPSPGPYSEPATSAMGYHPTDTEYTPGYSNPPPQAHHAVYTPVGGEWEMREALGRGER